MKKVAGKLRLDLSQYRELEAFAQFGSELDPETQKQLARGERMVAALNQNERQPMSVAEQVASIFAGNEGYLDRIKAERVGEFLPSLLERLRAEHADLLDRIEETGELSDEDEEALSKAMPRWSTTSGPTSTRRASRSRRASPTGSTPRRSGPPRAGPPAESRSGDEAAEEEAGRDRQAVEPRHGHAQGSQEPDLERQERSEDHARDGDGRRGAAAPGRAADRQPAALRAGAAQDDPPGGRGGRGRGPQPARAAGARGPEKVGVLLVTGDRGLAGSFNSQIIRAGIAAAGELEAEGKRGRVLGRRPPRRLDDALPRRGAEAASTSGFTDRPAFADAREIADELIAAYVDEELDRVDLIYNRYVSPLTQYVRRQTLLPIQQAEVFGEGVEELQRAAESEEQVDEELAEAHRRALWVYEPEPEELLAELIPEYAQLSVYRALLESTASEHGSRMTAMRNAADNAKEVIGDLTLEMNRVRQAEITQEILEVVGGAEALS